MSSVHLRVAHSAPRSRVEGGQSNFHLVRCDHDCWQAYLEGHRSPLSDEVPLDRALEIVVELAQFCERPSLHVRSKLSVERS